jgi:7,8-dihydroneopterin aldolase/epimerase/oxygenase
MTDRAVQPVPADRISLRGLAATGYHGVLPAERRDGQTFVVDLDLTIDTRPAAMSDNLHDTVDYAGLAASVVDIVQGPPVNLIETLAAHVADACLTDPRVSSAAVTVHKPNAPVGVTFSDVAVTIERSRV